MKISLIRDNILNIIEVVKVHLFKSLTIYIKFAK